MPREYFFTKNGIGIVILYNRKWSVQPLRRRGLRDPTQLSTFQFHLRETKTAGVLLAQILLTVTYVHEDLNQKKIYKQESTNA